VKKISLLVFILISLFCNAEGYPQELERINAFIADGYYGHFEVKDAYVTLQFRDGI
jgi:hypothetical protein